MSAALARSEHGADPAARSSAGSTAADLAFEHGHVDLLPLLEARVAGPRAARITPSATAARAARAPPAVPRPRPSPAPFAGDENASPHTDATVDLRACAKCDKMLPEAGFSKRQWKQVGARRRCKACVDA